MCVCVKRLDRHTYGTGIHVCVCTYGYRIYMYVCISYTYIAEMLVERSAVHTVPTSVVLNPTFASHSF